MATLDWPTAEPFRPQSAVPGMRAPKAAFRHVYTGDRDTLSHLADRLRLQVVLPPTNNAGGVARQAFVEHLVSSGDWVRMAVQHQLENRGTFSGSPTVAAAASAGARSIQLAGVLARPNLLRNGRTIGDAPWQLVRTTIASNVQAAPDGTLTADEVVDSDVGDNAHFIDHPVPGLPDNAVVTVSACIRAKTNGFCRLAMINKAGATVGTAFDAVTGALGTALNSPISRTVTALGAGWYRVTVTVSVASGASEPEVRFALLESISDISFVATGAFGMYLWDVQCVLGTSAPDFSAPATALGGDWLSVNGNLLSVRYEGATANDNGDITLPLVLPLPRAVAAGSAVSLVQPTGVWQLDVDQFDFPYGRGAWQGAITLPFIQQVV